MKKVKQFLVSVLISACVTLHGDDTAQQVKSQSKLLPFSKTSYYHFAKDQNLSELIRDFFAMQGITVIVSDAINYNVNGRFSKMDPAEFWDYITKAYGLIWFFDGKIMFVYSNSELQTQILKMDVDSIGTLSAIINRLGFVASDFSFRGVGEANVLIVTAPPQYIAVINDISSKFVPSKISDTTVVKVFPLKYAWAYDMSFNYANGSISVPGVASLLQGIVTGRSSSSAFSPFNVNVGSQKLQQQNMVGILDDTPDYAKEINKNIKGVGDTVKSGNTGNKQPGGSGAEGGLADISGATLPGFITCDQRLNAIVIRDSRENMPFYEDIIRTLDVPCEVIKIDAAVVNVNKNATVGMGIRDFGVKGRKVNVGWSINADKSASATGGSSKGSVAGNLTKILKGGGIDFAIDVLESNAGGEALSKPSVLTLDNVAAVLETDKTQYIPVSGTNTANAYGKTATTKLQVVPHIIPGEEDASGKRKMKLFVDISEGDFDQSSAAAEAPVIQHSLNTQAVIYEGQSLLIGGYNTETNTKEVRGFPLLKDVPLLGMMFRHTEDVKSVKERVYVVSPSVVEVSSDDHKYDRFVQPGDLSADGSLAAGQYSLKKEWSKETNAGDDSASSECQKKECNSGKSCTVEKQSNKKTSNNGAGASKKYQKTGKKTNTRRSK